MVMAMAVVLQSFLSCGKSKQLVLSVGGKEPSAMDDEPQGRGSESDMKVGAGQNNATGTTRRGTPFRKPTPTQQTGATRSGKQFRKRHGSAVQPKVKKQRRAKTDKASSSSSWYTPSDVATLSATHGPRIAAIIGAVPSALGEVLRDFFKQEYKAKFKNIQDALQTRLNGKQFYLGIHCLRKLHNCYWEAPGCLRTFYNRELNTCKDMLYGGHSGLMQRIESNNTTNMDLGLLQFHEAAGHFLVQDQYRQDPKLAQGMVSSLLKELEKIEDSKNNNNQREQKAVELVKLIPLLPIDKLNNGEELLKWLLAAVQDNTLTKAIFPELWDLPSNYSVVRIPQTPPIVSAFQNFIGTSKYTVKTLSGLFEVVKERDPCNNSAQEILRRLTYRKDREEDRSPLTPNVDDKSFHKNLIKFLVEHYPCVEKQKKECYFVCSFIQEELSRCICRNSEYLDSSVFNILLEHINWPHVLDNSMIDSQLNKILEYIDLNSAFAKSTIKHTAEQISQYYETLQSCVEEARDEGDIDDYSEVADNFKQIFLFLVCIADRAPGHASDIIEAITDKSWPAYDLSDTPEEVTKVFEKLKKAYNKEKTQALQEIDKLISNR